MRELLNRILKWFLCFLLVPIGYLVVSIVLTSIPVNQKDDSFVNNKTVYLATNGIHLSVIIPTKYVAVEVLEGLIFSQSDKYLSFSWGDEVFYLNTPTWGDLTFRNAFRALLIKTPALVHLIRYSHIRDSWIEVKLNDLELKKLNQYLLESFKKDTNDKKSILLDKGYSYNDDFYMANGSYSLFKTSNTWVNKAFKESGMKACLWTPFDLGLIKMYD